MAKERAHPVTLKEAATRCLTNRDLNTAGERKVQSPAECAHASLGRRAATAVGAFRRYNTNHQIRKHKGCKKRTRRADASRPMPTSSTIRLLGRAFVTSYLLTSAHSLAEQ